MNMLQNGNFNNLKEELEYNKLKLTNWFTTL